jgi:hypothetical protein
MRTILRRTRIMSPVKTRPPEHRAYPTQRSNESDSGGW